MSEYWVSQPRKFCPQCKCWTADNKASRDFHEMGKKHKEAVALELKDARKRGADKMNSNKELERALIMMEKKAKQAVEKEKANWSKKVDEKTGAEYYYNSKSGESSWTVPASLKADVKAEAKAEQASASDVMTSVDQVNALIYNKKKKEEDKTTGYTDVDKQTGLGVWGTGTFLEDLPPEGGAYDDLPEQADIFTVREEKYKVKTIDVIEGLELKGDTNFKKSRARNVRKRKKEDED